MTTKGRYGNEGCESKTAAAATMTETGSQIRLKIMEQHWLQL
jgi:hypothetical protein